jgi:nitroreductase
MIHKEIKDAIIRSQHCQRNWDLNRSIPQEDLELLITAATQCPSKQNVAFYKLHFITNRSMIEKIAEQTNGFIVQRTPEIKTTINTQVLANLVVVFEEHMDITRKADQLRNEQTRDLSEPPVLPAKQKLVHLIKQKLTRWIPANSKASATMGPEIKHDSKTIRAMDYDMKLAVGVAAGYLNLTASMLGYATGCCSCFMDKNVQETLGLENRPILLMGIGFKDPSRNRRIHQNDKDFVFPSIKKQDISVNFIT